MDSFKNNGSFCEKWRVVLLKVTARFMKSDRLFLKMWTAWKLEKEEAKEWSAKMSIIASSRAYAYARATRSFCVFAVTSVTVSYVNIYFPDSYAMYSDIF